MSRFLALSLLAACSLGRHAAPPAVDPIDDWLTHWNTTRSCIVANAENIHETLNTVRNWHSNQGGRVVIGE